MPNLTNGRKLGIGLGIVGALMAAAGAALALIFGKKKGDVELIDCDETMSDDVVDADETSVEE